MKHFEFIEHTADIAIRAFGASLDEAFASVADAMFEVITDSAEIRRVNERSVTVDSDTVESLLVNFLSELIVLHEVDRVVLTDFTVRISGEYQLTATAWCEPFDASRHAQGHHVKGVSYHMMEVHDGQGRNESYVQVLFDV